MEKHESEPYRKEGIPFYPPYSPEREKNRLMQPVGTAAGLEKH